MEVDIPSRCCLDTPVSPGTSGSCLAEQGDRWESPDSQRAPARLMPASHGRCRGCAWREGIGASRFDSSESQDSIYQISFDLLQRFTLGFGEGHFDKDKSQHADCRVEPKRSCWSEFPAPNREP